MTRIEKPFEDCYWVAPGQLLAGEYPGHYDAKKARTKLGSLVAAGVDYFVDLTSPDDPLERYEDMLRELGDANGGKVVWAQRTIRDMGCPTTQQMREILDEIDRALALGRRVYVHCWGGIGRTGTVVGCHLVRKGMSGAEALAQVARLYATMSARKRASFPDSPQTDRQRAFVLDWHRHDHRSADG